MKKGFFSIIVLCTAVFQLYGQAEKEITAPPAGVVVYPDRARISSDAAVEIPAGKSVVRLTGLSPYIDPQSIQVKGTGEFTILSVNHRNNYLSNLEEEPGIKNIRSQIEALQLKIEDEKTAIATLDEKLSFMQANRDVMLKAQAIQIEQFKALIDVYTTNIEQINSAKLRKTRLIKDYEQQVAALQQQLADRKNKGQMPSGEIAVNLSADKPLNAKLSFSYIVSNAGWHPTYDIRVDDITKPVVIFYKANVFQNTGTEWKNVKLSFSTATPWISGTLPVLNPWFIDFYMLSRIQIRGVASGAAKSEAPVMLESVAMADRNTFLKKEAEAAPVAVEKREGEMSITFDISVPYTIPSDGKIQTIEIQRTTTPADYKYVTIPKISNLAYLTGNITGWAQMSLLSGEATLYFENTYVGKSFLDVNQLSDTLTISLGTDPGVLVKREKRKDFTTRRTIGANKTETYSFLITVRNNKKSPVKISIQDQVPVSSNSSITVETPDLSGGKLNAETGAVTWDLDLKPGETKEIILTYSVRYPRNQTVILE